jgi:FkbM family methyltransferase
MFFDSFASIVDGVSHIVDVSRGQTDLKAGLRIPQTMPYARRAVDEFADVDLARGCLVVGLLGPGPGQDDPRSIAPVLASTQPGALALMLLGWPAEDVPRHRLLGPLVDGDCQIVRAISLHPAAIPGVHGALVAARVDQLAPLAPGLAGVRSDLPWRAERGAGAADEWRTVLRVANEYMLAEFAVRALRERLVERDGQLRVSERKRAAAVARLKKLTASTTFQVGRAFVEGARRPAGAVVTIPRDLVRVWRGRRAQRPAAPMATGPNERVVPVAMPFGARVDVLTITAPPALLVPRKLAQNGLAGYEPESMACFLAAMDVAGPGAVLDIGANVGIYAAVASASTERRVVAFEPAPALVEVARRLATDNGLDYVTEALALGSENGSALLHLSDSSDTSHSLAAGFRPSSSQVQVRVETVDSYVVRTGTLPAVLKVDSETTEPDILAGAAATIVQHRPWILCEVLAGRVETRLTEVLAPFGYQWYHITSEIPYRAADVIEGDRTYQHLMWLFAPEPLTEKFWTALRERTADLAECTVERATLPARRQTAPV